MLKERDLKLIGTLKILKLTDFLASNLNDLIDEDVRFTVVDEREEEESDD